MCVWGGVLDYLHWYLSYIGSSSRFIGLLFIRTFFTSQLSLDCSAGNVLEQMIILFWFILGQGNYLDSEYRDGYVTLAGNSWIGLLN